MKSTIEIEIPVGSEEKAIAVLQEAHVNGPSLRAKVGFTKAGRGKLVVTVIASDFTALRALVTSTLRDLKVVLDVFGTK